MRKLSYKTCCLLQKGRGNLVVIHYLSTSEIWSDMACGGKGPNKRGLLYVINIIRMKCTVKCSDVG